MSTPANRVEELADPVRAAESAGLVYVNDDEPGIRREREGDGFTYLHPNGKVVRDEDALERIRKLAIPPAWTDVWICTDPRGHIQATGRDARGRKQYKYHPQFREQRESTKYEHMIEFARALPDIRARLQEHMALRGLPREKVLATIVHLLETTLIRVGNDDYARTNKSYGLTTLRNPHVKINGSELRFQFKGKSGKTWRLQQKNPRVAKIIRSCQELPGQRLFQYVDEEGEVREVTSADVNDYLREITGRDITAKDFRTWAGTVLTALSLRELAAADARPAACLLARRRAFARWNRVGSSEWDDSRSIPLSALRPLLALQHVRVFGLQQGRPAHHALAAGLDVVPLWQHTSSIVTAAAALLEMDLLITIDGMATHLGAMLGRPTWVLLKHEADWRWMRSRSDWPWYPTVRLFRQQQPDDWDGLVVSVADALRALPTGIAPSHSPA